MEEPRVYPLLHHDYCHTGVVVIKVGETFRQLLLLVGRHHRELTVPDAVTVNHDLLWQTVVDLPCGQNVLQ